jgi:hypothetical protein
MGMLSEKRLELFIWFEQCVKEQFCFLRDMKCRTIKTKMGWQVNYYSRKTEINIYYERISFEIYLSVLLKKLKMNCMIDEIIRPDRKRLYFSAMDKETIKKAIIELRILLVRYGFSFIEGDDCAYNSISSERQATNKAYELEMIEKMAVENFKKGNYKEVIELYKSIGSNLTLIQEKRLRYSLKKIQQGNILT